MLTLQWEYIYIYWGLIFMATMHSYQENQDVITLISSDSVGASLQVTPAP